MAKHYIHINRHRVASNKKLGAQEPVIAVKRGRNGRAVYGNEVLLIGPNGEVFGRVLNRPSAPLPCGATVYVELEEGVRAVPVPEAPVT